MSMTTRLLAVCVAAGSLLAGLPAASAPEGRKPKERTPMSVAKELAKRLNRQDMAWQFYSDYSEYYYEQARRCAAFKPRTKPQKALQKQWVAHYRRLGDMITKMRDLKRKKDGIQKHTTDVPFDERSSVYKKATAQHRQLLDDFVAAVKAAPKQRLPLVPSR